MQRLFQGGLNCFSTESFQEPPKQQHYDILIVGGGAVGLTMAKVLQESCPRYSLMVLDQGNNKLNERTSDGSSSSSSSPLPIPIPSIPHPRSYALSPKSLSILGSNVCSQLENLLGEYHSMQIWEANSPAMLVFSNHDVVPAHSSHEQIRLGACVEDSALISALQASLSPNCIRNNTRTTKVSFPSNRIVEITTCPTTTETRPHDTVTSTSTSTSISTFTSNLLIAADGAQSPIRNMLGIGWKGVDYGRSAVTFTVELDPSSASRNVKRAYQRFLPNGPIALLPTYSKHHAVVVWSTTPVEAAKLKSMDSSHLVQLLNETLQQGPQRLRPLLEKEGQTDPFSSLLYGMERVLDTVHYGMGMRHWSDDPEKFLAPPKIASLPAGAPRFTFPLSCKLASSYIDPNHAIRKIALIGDAAHTVHPMAGQGLNIGLEDVEVLGRAIQKAHDCGMEAGQFVLDYQMNRQWNVPLKVGGIHLLHSLFGMQQSSFVMHGKSLGMSMLNHWGPLRRELAKIATGLE